MELVTDSFADDSQALPDVAGPQRSPMTRVAKNKNLRLIASSPFAATRAWGFSRQRPKTNKQQTLRRFARVQPLSFDPAIDRARVDLCENCSLVNRDHLGPRTTRGAPGNDSSGTTDEQYAFRFDGDFGSLFFHAYFRAVTKVSWLTSLSVWLLWRLFPRYNLRHIDIA